MFSVFLSVFCAVYQPARVWADVRVRKVQVQQDQIVTVRTAMGIATIIQVPDRPNSLVVGNQSGFKVEYLDQAITIKPSFTGARSNLYIYTDYRRYNVQLVTTSETAADYVVYLDNPVDKPKSVAINWVQFSGQLRNDNFILGTKRMAKTKDGVLLLEFEITSETKDKFKPEWVWLTQGKSTRPIHGLMLSGDRVGPTENIQGIMQILRSDLNENEAPKIEFRRAKTTYLTLPKVSLWK